MDQIKHLTPINLLIVINGIGSVFDCSGNQLHLFNAVFDKFELQIQGVAQHMVVRIANRHIADVIQGKSQIF